MTHLYLGGTPKPVSFYTSRRDATGANAGRRHLRHHGRLSSLFQAGAPGSKLQLRRQLPVHREK
ncbi:hypothetical protein ABT214_16815 [Micromonospora purpureochromogenes]|uniref:hypothetical protein n=1 Tax=Micromonospora purpureochromogenes TaxID=47872 RepID=UPI00332C49C9